MGRRAELQVLLEEVLGSRNVYYQPPETLKMSYPCIVYALSAIDAKHSDNRLCSYAKRYTVTVIDRNPDSAVPERVLKLPYCRYDRRFVSDNLYHDVFDLYY